MVSLTSLSNTSLSDTFLFSCKMSRFAFVNWYSRSCLTASAFSRWDLNFVTSVSRWLTCKIIGFPKYSGNSIIRLWIVRIFDSPFRFLVSQNYVLCTLNPYLNNSIIQILQLLEHLNLFSKQSDNQTQFPLYSVPPP